jgi:probable HAF family extracellular repeat protein
LAHPWNLDGVTYASLTMRARGFMATVAVVAVVAGWLSSCDNGGPSSAPAQIAAIEVRGDCAPGFVARSGHVPIAEIRSLGGNQVFIEDVNDDGVAVGGASTANGNVHAIRYTDSGGVEDLGALGGFGARSLATAIASDGAIGGQADHADGTAVLFGHRFTAAAGRSEICPASCSVWDLNASGQVVGLLPGRDPSAWQAFLYSPGDGLRALGTLGGQRSSASGISDAGVVVGNAQIATSASGDIGRAFIYDSRQDGAAMRDLNVVADARGWLLQTANDVNDAFVAGYGRHGETTRAYRIDLATRAVHDLGTIPGGGDSFAWGVDRHGDVVGWAKDELGRKTAFVYAAGLGGIRRLADFVDPALGWELAEAKGINAHGMIVGSGTRHGEPRGFKLALPVCVGQ